MRAFKPDWRTIVLRSTSLTHGRFLLLVAFVSVLLDVSVAEQTPDPRPAPSAHGRELSSANSPVACDKLLVVRRKVKGKLAMNRNSFMDLGLPSNHECNSALPKTGYDNEIAVLSLDRPQGDCTTLYRPAHDGYVGEIDLHWDGQRLLFTQSDAESWKIWEIRTDGSGLRQVSPAPPDVDCFDACYLPDGRIVFGSTACWQAVPCWHGQRRVTNLYLMNADGSGVRQVCFDQDHDFHPVVLNNGQVLYHRWDYTGINHIFLRELMVMNPDGTGQRAIYGINSWYPNSLYFPRPLPGDADRLVSILSGYHGAHRMGQLVLVDTSRGWFEADGLVRRISGRGDPIAPAVRDELVDKDWPKFLHPYPLNAERFLVACWPDAKSGWGIYLADTHDHLRLLREEPGCALLEPVPLMKRPKPPIIADKVDLQRDDGVVYLHDVYAGPGLAGVPRGTVKSLRVIAYHFGYPGLAGPDKIGYGGPWEVMRILGTVPLEEDGSVMFRVPANTPLAVQTLDVAGRAVQLMRSWFTVMPGETLSCVGCHETPADVAPSRLAQAALRGTREIVPWHGPARGFDFAREVQPVLNRHCVTCHDGRAGRPDLRPEEQVASYRGRRLSKLGVDRLHPQMRADTEGFVRYTPAYEALIPYIRRVGIEDDVSMLVPGEYHADTSELIQMLRKGHQGAQLDAQAWDRLVTWIDLNGPCHGTWGDVYPVPDGAHQRRMELRRACGGPRDDPEAVPERPRYDEMPVEPTALPKCGPAPSARATERTGTLPEKTIDLPSGVTMRLVRIPAGEFVMGDTEGEPDEQPLARVVIERPFWMATCEVTNEQFRLFDPDHDCRYYQKRHARSDDQGLPLNGPRQPVVRVSWEQAVAFCRWLSERTGRRFTLPTEAQWEYACRAGTTGAYAGEADRMGWHRHNARGGAQPVAQKQPNAWGLYDMHGNAWEWCQDVIHETYDGAPADGSAWVTGGKVCYGVHDDYRVLRGGAWCRFPRIMRSASRYSAFPDCSSCNIGFRIVRTRRSNNAVGKDKAAASCK